MKKLKYTNEKVQEFLNEWNDSASIAELQAWDWGKTQGKINFIQNHFEITDAEAKNEINKWLKSLGY